MKRRQFIKLVVFTTVAAAVPMVALASGKTPPIQGSEITWDEIMGVQEMFESADISGTTHIFMHPSTYEDMKNVFSPDEVQMLHNSYEFHTSEFVSCK